MTCSSKCCLLFDFYDLHKLLSSTLTRGCSRIRQNGHIDVPIWCQNTFSLMFWWIQTGIVGPSTQFLSFHCWYRFLLGPGFTQHQARQLEKELHSLGYKGKHKHKNFQMYVAHHEKIYWQMQNLKNDGYARIDPGTHVHYFLGEIDKPSLKTAVQICDSQDQYSISFQNCALYLTTMVQCAPDTKQINVEATANKVNCINCKNKDSADWCLPPAKYLGSVWCTQVKGNSDCEE